MKEKALKALVVLLAIALAAALTMSVTGLLDPIVFWVLAGITAVFAFLILPKMGKGKQLN